MQPREYRGILLAPVNGADNPCGADLENDPAFTAFDRATQGKPEQQIGKTIIPAEEPDWKSVGRLAIELLARTKDLRVAVHMTKALLHTDGLPGLADGLTVLQRFVETYWEGLHPRLDPDDGNDPTMRVNILATLTAADVLSTVRATPLISSRTVGRFSYRDVEAAGASSSATNGGGGTSLATIDAAGLDCELGALEGQIAAAKASSTALKSVESMLSELLGAGVAPTFGPLAALLQKIAGFLQAALARRVPTADGEATPGADDGARRTLSGGRLRVGRDPVA